MTKIWVVKSIYTNKDDKKNKSLGININLPFFY